MPDATDLQSAAYTRMLPQLLRDYGPAWIVMADQKVKGHFATFQEAATFAIEHFPTSQFLIRHTQEKAVEFTYITTDG